MGVKEKRVYRVQIQPIKFPHGIITGKLTPQESLNMREVRRRLLPGIIVIFDAKNGQEWKVALEKNIFWAIDSQKKKLALCQIKYKNDKDLHVLQDLNIDTFFNKLHTPWAVVTPAGAYSDKHEMLAYLGHDFVPGIEDINQCEQTIVKRHLRVIIDRFKQGWENVYFGWSWSPFSWGEQEEREGYQTARFAHIHIWTWTKEVMIGSISPKVKDPLSKELAKYLGFVAGESGAYVSIKGDILDYATIFSRQMRSLIELLIRLIWDHNTNEDKVLLSHIVAKGHITDKALQVLRKRWRIRERKERKLIYTKLKIQGLEPAKINILKKMIDKILKYHDILRQGLGFAIAVDINDMKLYTRIATKLGPGGPVETLGVELHRPLGNLPHTKI